MSLPAEIYRNPLASSRTLVVGGSSGLGAAVVSAALANGGSVHVSSSNPEKIAAKLAEFKALYPQGLITSTAANLSDATTIEENVKLVLEQAIAALGGPIDHLVYTAGDPYKGQPLSELDPKTYFETWNVRYMGPMVFAKVICSRPGAYLKVNATSSITFTSGLLAHKPIAGVANFVGWAGAIEAASRGLAVDMAPVRVNVVAPGAVLTEMLATLDKAVIEEFGRSTLVKRVGAAHEAAEAYLFSMRSAFLTGQVIKIDGGAFYT